MQRKWASMWLMSQEQGLWPVRSAEPGEAAREVRESTQKTIAPLEPARPPLFHSLNDSAGNDLLALPLTQDVADQTVPQAETETFHPRFHSESVLDTSGHDRSVHQNSVLHEPAAERTWTTETTAHFIPADVAPENSHLAVQTFQLSASDDCSLAETASETTTEVANDATTDAALDSTEFGERSLMQRLADLRVTLRFHRADLYLGAAVFVAVLALFWPTASATRPATLSPWERALVTLGIAEAPAPVVHVHGDPALQVWVDPHTALYYCPGEEQYGKTADGRLSSQREAQMERFEPAGRSPCD